MRNEGNPLPLVVGYRLYRKDFMEAYLEDNRPSIEELCNEYEECTEDCPAYGFCHGKTESEEKNDRSC